VTPTFVRSTVAAILVLLATAVPSAARPRAPGALRAPISLVPTTSEPLEVDSESRFFGSIRLDAASDGLVVINRLPLERYLLGLQEVPTTWPEQALQAQAVAARTYALNTLSRPPAGAAATYGFDICASVECQVFAGADVLTSLSGIRWKQAVEDTAGVAVLRSGDPILARYHSTSGGRTFDNSQIFTTEPDYPYLQGVTSRAEEASPLYRWRVEFSLRDLRRLLVDAGWWTSGDGRILAARTVVSSEGYHYPDVLFVGTRGRLRTSAEDFRSMARDLAPALWPDRYPSPWRTTSGRLPETLPSNRITIKTTGNRAVIVGRGWGHGVGMSQWGAHGMALQGASFEEILTHYYTDVAVDEYADPGPIEVGIDWARSTVSVSGAFRVVDAGGRTIVEEALGTWRFGTAGADVVSLDPPRGFGLPLEVGIVDAPRTVAPGGVAQVTVALSKPARLRTLAASGNSPALVADAGRQEVEWFAPEDPGRYRIRVEASVGEASRRTEAVEILVAAEPEERTVASRGRSEDTDGGNNNSIYFVIAVLVGLIILVAKVLAGRIRG
jgi:stage II sporulation protein D